MSRNIQWVNDEGWLHPEDPEGPEDPEDQDEDVTYGSFGECYDFFTEDSRG